MTERRVTAPKPERKRHNVTGIVRPAPVVPTVPARQPPGPRRQRRPAPDAVVDVVLVRE